MKLAHPLNHGEICPTSLPLPLGEGRGEGESSNGNAPSPCPLPKGEVFDKSIVIDHYLFTSKSSV
jgi:hypothetical protein